MVTLKNSRLHASNDTDMSSWWKTLGARRIIKGRSFVFISNQLDYITLRMVLPHEISHYILHRDLLKSRLIDNHIFDMRSITECEATLVASPLIHEDGVLELLPYWYTQQRITAMLSIHVDFFHLKLKEITLSKIDTDYIRPSFINIIIDTSHTEDVLIP